MSRAKRVILALVIVFVLIATAVAIVIGVLFNTTFEKMGVSDKPVLNGKSIADMKLEQYTPKDLMPLAKSLFRDSSSVVNYAPSTGDRQALDSVYMLSSIASLTGIHYSRLIYTSATFANVKILALTDKQLSALLNNVVRQAPNDILLSPTAELLEYLGVKAIKDVLDCIVEYDVTVEQMKLTAVDKAPHMQLLLSMDISKHTEGVRVPLMGKLDPKVYVALDYVVGVSVEGAIELSFVSLSVNGKDPAISERVLDGLFIALSKGTPMTTKSLAKGLASFLGVIFEHVGVIGNGTTIGASGLNVDNKTIYFVAE